MPIKRSIKWGDISITRTPAKHGRGATAVAMAPVSGFIISASGQPTTYITGDSIWYSKTKNILDKYKPDISICNCGEAAFYHGRPITMGTMDIHEMCRFSPSIKIVAAVSLLGVALHHGTSFPVGKVEFMDLYPLNFKEFMIAMGKEQFVEQMEHGKFDMVTTFKQTYIDMLKYYYYVGGMPEVVQNFAENIDFNEAREIQERILAAYEQDFSKHAPNEVVPRIRMLWNSIPAQLTKGNKKFIYGLIKEGARAKEYELAMLWLTDCGLVHMVHRVTTPSIPLKAYEDLKAFKLFLLDVGLLSCMVQLKQDTLIDGNLLFKEFKGALTEQYVLQQLKTIKGLQQYYWSNDRGNAEIDFIVDTGDDIVPIEVKAEVNLQAKSLKAYREKFNPHISIRTSMSDYKKEDQLLNLPLYAIIELKKELIN